MTRTTPPGPPLVAQDTLMPAASSVRRARRFVEEALQRMGCEQHADVATLLVSELVTNALVHAHGELVLLVSGSAEAVRVEVRDLSPAAPVMRAPDPDAETGRGMLLVQELASTWGVEPDEGGKAVWFELRDEPDGGAALPDLPRVLSDAPAAVLLVDLGRGEVVYANDQAVAMAPDARLPTAIDAWSAAAGLGSPTGSPLEDSASPLSRVAGGQPVSGEPVMGAATPDEPGRMLWVTGFPLDGSGVSGTALVVFFEMAGSGAAGTGAIADDLQAMRERAVVATDISFAISDPRLPDDPLVWVNPAFTRVTGYEFDEAVGRNCRYLQGPKTDREAVARLREAVATRTTSTVTLLNHRKDGTAFWNEVSISPVFDGEGALIHFVGVQADVTARVHAEQEREAAFRAESVARAEAERQRAEAERQRAEAESARAQMAMLAEVTRTLGATPRVDEALSGLVRLLVPALADCCSVDLIDGTGAAHRAFTAHVDPMQEDLLRRVGERTGARRAIERARDATGVFRTDVDPAVLAAAFDDPETRALYAELDPRSWLLVPLRAGQRVLGALSLVMTGASGRRFTSEDEEIAREIGQRAGQAVDLARLYAHEHEAAVALQRSLLPVLADVDGVTLGARYLTGTDGVEVGGDWYDVLVMPDGAVGLAIGDVMGHDLSAAAAMGQLRSVLRSYAWEGDAAGAVLDKMDRLVQGLGMAQLATAVYARLEPVGPDGRRALHYANAGHLAPLVRRSSGGVEVLDDGRSVLLGAAPGVTREEASVTLAPGDTLLLYTDGLVERRRADLDQHLVLSVERHDPADGPEALCDRVLADLQDGRRADDTALLAVQLR